MKKNIFVSVFLALVLGSCQKATETTPTIDPASLVETMMATIQGESTPTGLEGTPIPDNDLFAEHFAKVMEGKDAWNLWRTQNPDIIPFLVKANLQEANLKQYNLLGANLSSADLTNANLERVNLKSANLKTANLRYANLRSSTLNRANLVGVNLTGANLIKANLTFTNLTNANLINANLTGADLTNAILTKAKYSEKTKWPEGFDPVAAGAILVVP